MSAPLRTIAAFALASLATIAAPRVAIATGADPTTAECLMAHETFVTLRKGRDLRGARAALRSCAMPSCPSHVVSECAARLPEIEAALPTLLFEVKDSRGEDVANVRLTIDGEPAVLDGFPVEVNPGDHVFRFAAPDLPSVEKRLTVRASEKDRRERIVIVPPTHMSAGDEPAAASPAPSAWPAQKTIAIVTGGLGLVAIGTGAAFGLSASGNWSDSQRACPSSTDCADHSRAVDERNDAQRAATIATITFGVGAAAIIAAVVLWVTSPHTSSSATRSRSRSTRAVTPAWGMAF